MSTDGPPAEASVDWKVRCPSCGKKGKTVKPITIHSLIVPSARRRVTRTDGFRFCAEPSCAVAYFHPETRDSLWRSDVKVRIGQKETLPPRPICYCFDHTVEEIENEVARTGTSRIPDEITEKCRQGLDRCEETNPQGACCLGNIRRALKEAQAKLGQSTPIPVETPKESDEIEEGCCAMNSTSEKESASRLDAGVRESRSTRPQGCAVGLQAKLTKLRGVSEASMSYDRGQAVVIADSSVDEEELRKTVSDAGDATSSVTKR